MTLLLATLSGVLAIAAYPDIGWWPLIFVCWVPLLVAVRDARPRRRFLLGWLSGTILIAGNQHWIATTLVNLSGFSWVAAVPCLVLYSALIGAMWGVFTLAYGALRRWSGRTLWVVTVPLFYALLERAYPQLFPLYGASALWEVPVLVQSAEWIGTNGVTALVMLATCALVHTIEDYARGRTSDQLVPTAVAALWLVVSVWGVVRMRQVSAAPIRSRPVAALVQPNVTVAEKRAPDPRVREAVFDRTAAMTREALRLRPDLVVWPEGGFPFTYQPDVLERPPLPGESRHHRYSRRLHRLALELGVPFVAGALRSEGDQVRNSAVFFPRGGTAVQTYDKRRLLLFGERVPFADWFPSLRKAVQGMSHHEPGEDIAQWTAAGLRWTPSICYEAIFPNFTREALNAGDGGDVLLNLTNDVWFGPINEPKLHLMGQVTRAIEDRVWIVRSTNSGVSAFVDPTGTVRAQAAVGKEAVLALEMPVPAMNPSVYRKHGDLLGWLSLLLAALWLLWRNQDDLRNFWRRRGVRLRNFWRRRGVRPDGQSEATGQ